MWGIARPKLYEFTYTRIAINYGESMTLKTCFLVFNKGYTANDILDIVLKLMIDQPTRPAIQINLAQVMK